MAALFHAFSFGEYMLKVADDLLTMCLMTFHLDQPSEYTKKKDNYVYGLIYPL